jgi:hypothetical protein
MRRHRAQNAYWCGAYAVRIGTIAVLARKAGEATRHIGAIYLIILSASVSCRLLEMIGMAKRRSRSAINNVFTRNKPTAIQPARAAQTPT